MVFWSSPGARQQGHNGHEKNKQRGSLCVAKLTEKLENNTGKKIFKDYKWARNALLVFLADILVILFSYFFALYIRFDFSFGSIPDKYLNGYLWVMPLWCILTVVVFYILRLYHVRDVINITGSSALVPVVFRLFKKRKFSVFLSIFTPIKGFVQLAEN